MMTIITSLGFLYAAGAAILISYALLYYRNFNRNGYQPRLFPWFFGLLAAACLGFLWISFHPLSIQKSYSNLDHHFLRHDGFTISKEAILGRSDTLRSGEHKYNEFRIGKSENRLILNAAYSEEPFYVSANGIHQLVSASWPVSGHQLSINLDTCRIRLSADAENIFVLYINDSLAGRQIRQFKRGVSAWTLFHDDPVFTNNSYYTNEKLIGLLEKILVLKSGFSNESAGELRYFLSSGIFQSSISIQFDGKLLNSRSLAFSASLPSNAQIGWGLGYPETNRHQFYIRDGQADSFRLINRYPVSYPLSADKTIYDEKTGQNQLLLKFLVADPADIGSMPGLLNEGFLFPAFPGDSLSGFSPMILQYRQERAGKAVKPVLMTINGREIHYNINHLVLPARQATMSWDFSIADSFDWKLGNLLLGRGTWEWVIYGSLLFFIGMVIFSAFTRPADKLSWVWQVMSFIVMLLLTTRFFLYWRYKSFPPYEGLDLPSVQQLNSFWNFGILVLISFFLGLVFGYSFMLRAYRVMAKTVQRTAGKKTGNLPPGKRHQRLVFDKLEEVPLVKKTGHRFFYWTVWLLLLVASAAFAVFRHFDPGTCRHLAIFMILMYFLFSYYATRFSPLVTASSKSWWRIDTGSRLHLLISNPARLLLSVSMLGMFSLIDIGFALVFLNFLLFNEAFVFVNYSIAGLSSGSRTNTYYFGFLALFFLLLFIANLLFGPFLINAMLDMPPLFYLPVYAAGALLISYALFRMIPGLSGKKRWLRLLIPLAMTILAFVFFPKERIQDKAAMTKYRIDVLTMPAAEAIEKAYRQGDRYEPVIRAAQNQWFINTFIEGDLNPASDATGFRILPHAPQNRGAKYNAQATDLVTSRFIIAEHGKWTAMMYVLILLLPILLLASFYKLYPDFTNRINPGHAAVSTGFALMNYLLISAMLVILAATGRYIFFGQDLPFGSILSKQSILFPALLIMVVVMVFNAMSLQRYPNRKKFLPAALVFATLFIMLFLIRPKYNRDRDFAVNGLAENMEGYIRDRVQPIWETIDSAAATRNLSLARKDLLFTLAIRQQWETGGFGDAPALLQNQLKQYALSGFSEHLDPDKMIYLDRNSGRVLLSVNDHFFHIEAPPHLQQYWQGNIFGDSVAANISIYNVGTGFMESRIMPGTSGSEQLIREGLHIAYGDPEKGEERSLFFINKSGTTVDLEINNINQNCPSGDSIRLSNPSCFRFRNPRTKEEILVALQPDAFMHNYLVNGSRFYYYPLGNTFTWARNFAEGIAPEFTDRSRMKKQVFISADFPLTDSLSRMIREMMQKDSTYSRGAEYAVCIADGLGRIWAMPDHIKEYERPDPNNKASFLAALNGKDGFVSQSELRRLSGNINLLRMNPGPGSTLKPIVFTSVASQLDLDWDAFASEGFSEKQSYYGGEKVAPYDFEKNNGRISTVKDYIRYSDNYYHSNLLLLGSYSKQNLEALLLAHFSGKNPEPGLHWPWFSYQGKNFWLDGFENWPGYAGGKARFGSDSSFVSVGLRENFGIQSSRSGSGYDRFHRPYDSLLFGTSYRRSGFILPEYPLFDQKGTGMNLDRPNEVFMSSFRGHVKGSSQVMIPPLKMLDAFGKLASQNRSYQLTFEPGAVEPVYQPFITDSTINYRSYLQLIRESLFAGMREALYSGTAARLGAILKKQGSPYFYFAKTGTTGDDELKLKSKLFAIIISKKDLSSPDFNFRNNRFVTIYFTSQKGPAKQNEEFQAEVIRMLEASPVFQRYMNAPEK